MPPESTEVQHTVLSRKWLMWMTIYIVVLTGFGIWCIWDGASILPARGREDAAYKEYQYLQAAAKASKLSSAGIANPEPEATTLAARRDDLRRAALTDNTAAMELARLDWLDSLALVGDLKPENTNLPNPSARLAELKTRWETASPPKPLNPFDIPLQWLMLGICAVVLAGVLYVLLTNMRLRYSYDPARKALTLPGGRVVTPADLQDVDKRKWHKFRCSLILKPDAQAVDLDLLRFEPLEEWVLEMEREAFPDRAEKDEPASGDSPSSPSIVA